MKRHRLATLIGCCLTLCPPAAGAMVEPWADQSLPVTQGLAAWLDAAPQPAAWRANGRQPLESQGQLDAWYDGSGNGRHFTQPVRGAQPKFIAGDKAAAVRFDGENDYLHQGAAPRELERFTLVMAVSPKSNAGGFRAFFSASEAG